MVDRAVFKGCGVCVCGGGGGGGRRGEGGFASLASFSSPLTFHIILLSLIPKIRPLLGNNLCDRFCHKSLKLESDP